MIETAQALLAPAPPAVRHNARVRLAYAARSGAKKGHAKTVPDRHSTSESVPIVYLNSIDVFKSYPQLIVLFPNYRAVFLLLNIG